MKTQTKPAHSPFPTKDKPWFVGAGIRSHDTAGICSQWHDGEETGEETIAEVLPTNNDNKTRDLQAAFIVKAVNNHDSLVNAVQCAESILTVDFATPDTVEGRRALSFVNSLRTLLSTLIA